MSVEQIRGASVRSRAGRGVARAAAAAALALLPQPAPAQYTIVSDADTLRFESAELRVLLDTARALYADLEEDPRVLYRTPLGRERVPPDRPEASYPWNVVTVESDSVADLVRLPANLREADRAYYNYAVQRMRIVRGTDPDVPCDSVLALEERAVSSFVDGWILTRTLFGGPPFAALDELAFARRDGHLRALLARRNDRYAGACAGAWADEHPDRIAAYEAWRSERFPQGEEIPSGETGGEDRGGENPGTEADPGAPADSASSPGTGADGPPAGDAG